MDTIKNFLVGILVAVMSFVFFVIIVLTWPFLLGISSVVLSIIAAVLFVVLVFYIFVLIGYVTREIIRQILAK